MPTEESLVDRPSASIPRFATVSLLLGILTVALLLPLAVVAGIAGVAILWTWGEELLSSVGPRSAEAAAVELLAAASLVAGVGIANWIGARVSLSNSDPPPPDAPPARFLRPWWTLGAILLVAELLAVSAGRQFMGTFPASVSVLSFTLWLGATITWAAVRLTRWVVGAGWRLATGSMAGMAVLGGLSVAAISLWIGFGAAAVAAAPEVQRRLELSTPTERQVPQVAALLSPPPARHARPDEAGDLRLAASPPDASAQRECLEQLTPSVRREAQKAARDRGVSWADAEDLVQDVALAVCARHHRDFKPYLIRSVQHAATNWWRRERRVCPLPGDPLPDCQPDPEAQFLSAEEGQVVRHARCSLGEDDQKILGFRMNEWLEYPEISERLGISEEAARQRVSRATARLKSEVERACGVGR